MRLLTCLLLLLCLSCQPQAASDKETEATGEIDTARLRQPESEGSLPPEETASITALDPTPRYDYDTTQWFDLYDLDPSIYLDLRYATTNNFVEEVMYECGRCFLRKPVAQAVVRAHKDLQERGYGGLKMFDCYRPRPIQWKLWERVPNPNYVADPRKGSMHNRGTAIDLTIVNAAGEELDMGTEFDFFGKEAHHDYEGHSAEIKQNRDVLKEVMGKQGFRWIRTEWWHYSYKPQSFPISDMLWACEL